MLMLFSTLAGCAALPTEQTGAFSSVAKSGGENFQALATAERDALTQDRLDQVARGEKRVLLPRSCAAPVRSAEPCYLVVGELGESDPERGLALIPRTPHLEGLIEEIGAYGEGMNDLAGAKDLETSAAAAGQVAASLGALATVLSSGAGAIATPVLKGLVLVRNDLAREKRRRLLLALAARADPLIAQAAQQLGDASAQLRATLINVRQKQLRGDMTSLNAPGRSAARLKQRRSLVAALNADAEALTAARSIKTDFSPLSRTHRAVIAALADPRVDVTGSIVEAQAYIDVLKSLTKAVSEQGGGASPAGKGSK